jgi:quinol monooxygenase YgiN
MFTRIVKMRFKDDKVTDFVTHFNSVREKVRNQQGCRSLLLYQDKNDSNTFFTYSTWEDESDLERYRKSDFFNEIWQETKQLFDGKPMAWSVDEIN